MKYYTDGACSGNPGAGGFGVAIYDEEDNLIDFYNEDCKSTTNNREELKGVIWVMENHGLDSPTPDVYTDSAYCFNTFTSWMFNWANNNWTRNKNKKVLNLDLIQKYYNLYQEGYRINLYKIKGHAGNKGNEVADALASKKISKLNRYVEL